MPEQMESLKNSQISTPRKGCNPILSTQRGKIQSQRSLINHQLCKQLRLRNGAENLFNATTNPKIKETVALELSFVNSNLQLLKEELNEINSCVEVYQNKNAKAVSIPMLPFGLKETKNLDCADVLENFITVHYKEDGRSFSDEIADLVDMRTSVKTPARTDDGIALLLDYYHQLYFLEKRFFSSNKTISLHFHWYDAISGFPSVQRSVSLEKASILFNIGALYSQIGTRGDRCHRKGIEAAIDAFQRSAGVFEYLKNNFANAPTLDLSSAFLSALIRLMLAQAQECKLELKMLGGFEIELGKCVTIAQAAMTVAERYAEADMSFQIESLKSYVPYSWINMTQVKSHHYRALSHYYAGLGLLEQHELAEPLEISKLLSSLYQDMDNEDIPKPDDAARKNEDRRRLGKSHVRHALFCHEQALQTHSLCKISRTVDVLKEYLHHAHQRTLSKFAEIENEEDFFELVEAPTIQAHSEHLAQSTPFIFECVPSKDIFRRLGPITNFSANHCIDPPRTIALTNQKEACGFTLHGDSPVFIKDVNENFKKLGFLSNDIIISVDDVDVKWSSKSEVDELISKKSDTHVTLRVVSVKTILPSVKANTLSIYNESEMKMLNGNNSNNNNNGLDINSFPDIGKKRDHHNSKHEENAKQRHSLGIFHGLKMRALQNRFATLNQNSSRLQSPAKRPVTLRRSSTTSKSFLRSGATLVRQEKTAAPEKKCDC